jgi:hypothetical protein
MPINTDPVKENTSREAKRFVTRINGYGQYIIVENIAINRRKEAGNTLYILH